MSFVRGARLMLAFFAFILLHQMCNAQTFTGHPSDPTIVVKGENSSAVLLRWEYDLKGKTRASVTFTRIKTVNGQEERLKVLSKSENSSPETPSAAYRGRVELIPAASAVTLRIRDVREDEDEAFFECQIVDNDFTPYTSQRIKLRILSISSDINLSKFCCMNTIQHVDDRD